MAQKNGNTYNFKVVLLGEGAVGKTSLVLRYVEDTFNPSHITTLQASFLNKKINVDGKAVRLSIWDTAGQEKFHALGPIYYRSSNGAILVYDITDEDSFQKVKNWVKELKKMLGSEIVLTIVGNKIDLNKDRTVPFETAEGYAQSVGAMHFETSAKNNVGVEDLFLGLTNMMIEAYDAKRNQENALNRSNSFRRPNTIIVADEEDEHDGDASNQQRSLSARCCGNG
ncbi:ras-related protein Rab-21 [Sitodiplosis mosellana]|uniref:ras-related protein Rab-21 n=1 Tax=Sitodiplosis mosellana TaxID=263140 RepID=UPI00244538C4|nr:ras-related protein Rab-21 [Sitodiplosis mosellana]XP_055304176.1 ras-related protein Rab-21 [Sitodiplosis mosellana]